MNEPEQSAPILVGPAVGRRLWYWPHPAEVAAMGMRRLDPRQPFDAGVAYVWSLREVNITASDHLGTPWSLVNVPLVQDGDIPPASKGYCQWMPFQLGQARKELERGEKPIDPATWKPAHRDPVYADADATMTAVHPEGVSND